MNKDEILKGFIAILNLTFSIAMIAFAFKGNLVAAVACGFFMISTDIDLLCLSIKENSNAKVEVKQ